MGWVLSLPFDLNIMLLTSQVVITQINGADQPSQSIHALHVGKMRMKLCKGKTTVAKEYYSSAMQVHFTNCQLMY